MTNADMVRSALQMLGVLGEEEHASADQFSHGIIVLNEIMADWEADGVGLEYHPQYEASDETPIPDEARAGVKGFLAAALSVYYGKTLRPEFIAVNDKFYARLVRQAMNDALSEAPRSRSLGTGQRYYESFE